LKEDETEMVKKHNDEIKDVEGDQDANKERLE
jgi:hypothetical protein